MASVTPLPLIGITTRLDAENNFYLKRYYAEAIEAAGGAPVHLPLIPNRRYLEALAGGLAGLVLSGSSSDLDPVLYGEEPHPHLGSVTPERDQTDIILLEIAEERKLPVLGICFGLQSLNVSRGGTLFQDLESQYTDPIKHQQGQAVDRPSHYITIEANSLLSRLAGGNIVRVNSSHHQAIKQVGRDLQVIARAHDGVIEAVIDPHEDRFVLGVQWHPEVGWERDEFSRAIFRSFLEAAS